MVDFCGKRSGWIGYTRLCVTTQLRDHILPAFDTWTGDRGEVFYDGKVSLSLSLSLSLFLARY